MSNEDASTEEASGEESPEEGERETAVAAPSSDGSAHGEVEKVSMYVRFPGRTRVWDTCCDEVVGEQTGMMQLSLERYNCGIYKMLS